MTPASRMNLADLVTGLDGAYDVLLGFIYAAEQYDQAADDALDAVTAAANYLHALKYAEVQ
jgi:hypothetical protein